MPAPPDLRHKILTWIGIIDQLTTDRVGRALAPLDLPLPQFVLLNHFSHRPDEAKTVTGVARAMQQPQPGITKTLQKMLARKLLRAEPDPADARSKLLRLTPKGAALHAKALATLAPHFAGAFQGWSAAELASFFGQLDRLKQWMDSEGRGPV